MLGQYAVEVPADSGITLPPGIAALASGTGSSKAKAEARRLCAILTKADHTAAVTAKASNAVGRPRRGLWKERSAPDAPLLSDVRLPEPDQVSNLDRLAGEYQQNYDDLDLSWSEAQLPERERTKHVHRLHPYLGKVIPQLVEALLDRYVPPRGPSCASCRRDTGPSGEEPLSAGRTCCSRRSSKRWVCMAPRAFVRSSCAPGRRVGVRVQ